MRRRSWFLIFLLTLISLVCWVWLLVFAVVSEPHDSGRSYFYDYELGEAVE